MGGMSAICDSHKKKVDGELLYKSVHRKFNQLGIMAVEKASTKQSGPPGERERNADGHKSGGQYIAVLFGLRPPLTHNPLNKVRDIYILKNSVARLCSVVVMILHADVYVLCGYITFNPLAKFKNLSFCFV